MSLDDAKGWGEGLRTLPNPYPERQNVPSRYTIYGDDVVQSQLGSKLHGLADEGSYYFIGNPAPGTALLGHAAATTLDDTKPTLAIKNNCSAAENRRIYLDYIEIRVVAIGTNNTDLKWAVKCDTTDRTLAAGSLITPVNCNQDSSRTSPATVRFGAVTAAAATSAARLMGHGLARSIKVVTLDIIRWTFGAASMPTAPFGIDLATKTHVQIPVAPVVIGPGHTFLFHLFATGQSVASDFEFNAGYWER